MPRRPWTDEARKRWSEKQLKRNEAFKAGAAAAVPLDPGVDDPGRSGGASGGRHGGGSAVESAEGDNLLSSSSTGTKAKEKPTTDKTLIDLPALKPAMPGWWIDYHELLSDVAQGITANKFFKRLWFVKSVTPEEARAEVELLWPMIERIVGKFVEKHPMLTGVAMVAGRPIMRLRSKEKPKEEKPNAESTAEKDKGSTA